MDMSTKTRATPQLLPLSSHFTAQKARRIRGGAQDAAAPGRLWRLAWRSGRCFCFSRRGRGAGECHGRKKKANKHVFAIYDTNMFGFFCVSLFAVGLGCIGKPKGEKAKWWETNKPNKFFWVVLGNQKEIRKKEKEKHWGVPSILGKNRTAKRLMVAMLQNKCTQNTQVGIAKLGRSTTDGPGFGPASPFDSLHDFR